MIEWGFTWQLTVCKLSDLQLEKFYQFVVLVSVPFLALSRIDVN